MIGSQTLILDGVVGVSGKPIRVHSVVVVSGSGGAGTLVLRDGTTDSGTVYVQEDGTAASKSKIYTFEGGLYFPSGCFFDKDDDIDRATVNFEQVQS